MTKISGDDLRGWREYDNLRSGARTLFLRRRSNDQLYEFLFEAEDIQKGRGGYCVCRCVATNKPTLIPFSTAFDRDAYDVLTHEQLESLQTEAAE